MLKFLAILFSNLNGRGSGGFNGERVNSEVDGHTRDTNKYNQLGYKISRANNMREGGGFTNCIGTGTLTT